MLNKIITKIRKIKALFKAHSFFISILCSLSFAIYNGFLGLVKHTIWNKSIFVYYLLLLIIRLILYRNRNKNKEKRTYIITSIILFIMNIVMILPAILLLEGQKDVKMTLIPALVVAIYTTYKVISVIYNLVSKKKKTNSLIIKQIKIVRLFDTAMSILTLQNTMIIVNNSTNDQSMHILSMVSTTAILTVLMAFSIISFITNLKNNKN